MTNVQLGLDLRDTALAGLEERRKQYVTAARQVAYKQIVRYGRTTVDKVREAYPPPPDFDARVMGCVLMGKQFRKSGDTKTTRPTSHARPIGIFGLAT